MSEVDQTLQVIASTSRPRSAYARYSQLLQGQGAQLLGALLLALALGLSLFYLLPLIHRLWHWSLTQLLVSLALPETSLISTPLPHFPWLETLAIRMPLPAPDITTLALHLALAALVWMLASRLRPPFQAPARLFAIFHTLCALFSLVLPDAATFSIEEHTRNLGVFSQGFLLLLPIVMALTHFIVERSTERRILASVLIALYLIASLPIKLLAHALLIHAASGMIMPTLFLVFGPALDILIVTTLYAWAVTWRHGQQ